MSSTLSDLPRLIPIRLPWEVRVGVSRIMATWKENGDCAIELDADFGGHLATEGDRRVQVLFRNAICCICQNEQHDDEVSDLFDWSELPHPGKTAAEFHAWQNLFRQAWERDGLALDSSIYRVIEPVPKFDDRYERFLIVGHDGYVDIWAESFDWKELHNLDGRECLTASDDGTTIL